MSVVPTVLNECWVLLLLFLSLQQLIDALVREDIRNIVLILGHASAEDITAPYSKDDGRTALHIAAALGNVVFVQLLLWVSGRQLFVME